MGAFVAKLVPTGTNVNDDYIPGEYALSQNYPNPFNPVTVINFQTGVSSHVTLKLFDVLGNEVATIVNGEKSSGRYEVQFDATGLSSGVYFYRLQAGKYIETKKMMVVK
ncbi:MAG: T9SS type A sorting domain-containing protein [Ignavibacteriales bacterium]|nr:T9SS type A sorting domain-containing protein [Ignavibacteriales bacterium]